MEIKGEVFGLARDEIVEGTRPERMKGRGGALVDWVLALPTFLQQSITEDREVMVAGARRRIRKYVEVLQCRRCCGYGHGYINCTGQQCCKRCGGPTEIRDCDDRAERVCVVCVGVKSETWDTRPDQGTALHIERNGNVSVKDTWKLR